MYGRRARGLQQLSPPSHDDMMGWRARHGRRGPEREAESMETREIPQQEWKTFLDQLSDEHEGWHVSVQVLLGDEGAQYLVEDLPLLGLSMEEKGSRASSIDIDAGVSADDHIEHSVDQPSHVRWVAGQGLAGTLEIEADGGPKTLVELRPPKA
jgi:hypothetical protein